MAAIHFNWIAILIAAVITFAVGGLWYAPPVFGKRWRQMIGEPAGQGSPASALALSGVVTLVAAILLAVVISWTGAVRYRDGLLVGLVGWAAFAGTGALTNVIFERRRFGVLLINGGYQLVGFLIMGAILAHWR